jgi:hypothetical protein
MQGNNETIIVKPCATCQANQLGGWWQPGWPDWANFRLFGHFLLWPIFLGYYLFHGKKTEKITPILIKNVLCQILGRFSHNQLVVLVSTLLRMGVSTPTYMNPVGRT